MVAWPYDRSVFLNCPFDRAYRPMLRAIMFAIHDCGFFARSALEEQDSSAVRFQKIVRIIRTSQFAIHDISRVQLDSVTRLPRFNMPLELGLFLGAKEFGDAEQSAKHSLVLDRTPYRYQKFCSDIAGQDIEAHANKPAKAIELVRNWLSGPANERGSRSRAARSSRPATLNSWPSCRSGANDRSSSPRNSHMVTTTFSSAIG
ncbi:MAG TPA: hypothetical protein VGQ65_03700 [Thermoanaerobaculia bacterium]|nr:hypothetical protein [Thermoanaerobaculia bacterium]